MRALVLMVVAACGRVGFDGRAPAGDGVSTADLTTGLIGWWKLDDGAGAAAADASSSGDNGALTAGVTWVPGQIGGAIEIDGMNNHEVDLGDPAVLHISGSMTAAAWVRASDFHVGTGNDEAIVGRDDAGRGFHGWDLKGTEDCGSLEHFALQIAIDPGSVSERCTTLIPSTGVWYHVTGVYDASAQTLDVYVNGALDDGQLPRAVPPSQYVPTSTVHAQIGNADPKPTDAGGLQTFIGDLDDVRIYDRALTAAEVAALASSI